MTSCTDLLLPEEREIVIHPTEIQLDRIRKIDRCLRVLENVCIFILLFFYVFIYLRYSASSYKYAEFFIYLFLNLGYTFEFRKSGVSYALQKHVFD